MDFTVSLVSMLSPSLLLIACAVFLTVSVVIAFVISLVVSYTNPLSKVATWAVVPSFTVCVLITLCMLGIKAYTFTINIHEVHKMVEQAEELGISMDPQLAGVYTQAMEKQSVSGWKTIGLYNSLHYQLAERLDELSPYLSSEEHAAARNYLSLCFPGQSGEAIRKVLAEYPSSKSDIRAEFERAMDAYSRLNATDVYKSGSEIPLACVASYATPKFL